MAFVLATATANAATAATTIVVVTPAKVLLSVILLEVLCV